MIFSEIENQKFESKIRVDESDLFPLHSFVVRVGNISKFEPRKYPNN